MISISYYRILLCYDIIFSILTKNFLLFPKNLENQPSSKFYSVNILSLICYNVGKPRKNNTQAFEV